MVVNLATGVEAFTSNVFLLEGERTALVDVGNDFDLVERVAAHTEDIDSVAITHGHPDHVGNLADVLNGFEIEVRAFDGSIDGVDDSFADGDSIALGDAEYHVLHTPGHREDHCCFYARDAGVLFAGDLVFADGAFGRTDLPGADRDTLVRSIDRLHDVVDADLSALHAGHGPSVTTDPYRTIELAGRAARN